MAHPFIRRVDIPTEPCHFCGLRFDGDVVLADGRIPGRRYVEIAVQLNGGDSPVPPGRIISQREEEGRTAYMTRDPSGAATTVFVGKPHVCSDCLAAAGREIGLGDTVPLQAAVDEAQDTIEALRRKVAAAEREIAALENASEIGQAFSRFLDAEQARTSRKPAARKAAA